MKKKKMDENKKINEILKKEALKKEKELKDSILIAEKMEEKRKKDAEYSALMDSLKSERSSIYDECIFPNQSGKTVKQVISELEAAVSGTRDPNQKFLLENQLKHVKDIAGQPGLTRVNNFISSLQEKIDDINNSVINPTLPNLGKQNGRITFRSVALKNQAKNSVAKDMDMLKKHKLKVEEIEKKIEDAVNIKDGKIK
jgi:hypothetical protein